jgi:pyruvate dehydrogenase E1 component alpha subunit/2-oxoisovalerate dehydrogenase E1 component alpha subunit
VSLTAAEKVRLYRELVRARRLDERLLALCRQGRIGFFGSAFGQEAVAVASALAIEPRDWVFPALREGAVMLVRGFPLELYLAQAFGSARDVQKGRQMPSHPAGRAANQVSWSSCIATQLLHAVGMAWAARHRGDRVVALAFLGDGATSHPDFHAALNFAGVLSVPVVFICQNNQYALSVPSSRQSRAESFAVKASAYGIFGERIDGNDALTVHETVRAAAERARQGAGPTFLECVTYRRGAHSTSDDPSRYRSAGEEAEWAERDPVLRLRRELELDRTLDAELEARFTREIDAEIERAVVAAEAEPKPDPRSLFDDVYEQRPWHFDEQLRSLLERSS